MPLPHKIRLHQRAQIGKHQRLKVSFTVLLMRIIPFLMSFYRLNRLRVTQKKLKRRFLLAAKVYRDLLCSTRL